MMVVMIKGDKVPKNGGYGTGAFVIAPESSDVD